MLWWAVIRGTVWRIVRVRASRDDPRPPEQSRDAGQLHRHVERDARPTVVHTLERDDVGVVATSRDDDVALADRGPARGVERVPVTHPGLDPRVALAGMGLVDEAVGV